MMGLVRKMPYEIMNAHMAIDFYLAELLVPDGAMETTKVILDVLMRKTTIDTTPPEDELPESEHSNLGRSPAGSGSRP